MSSTPTRPACLIKLILVGNSDAGKAPLIFRYCSEEEEFSESFISTIGIDFKIKTVMIDGREIKLQIWDTAGQERFKEITTSYLRGAHGILVVYNMNRKGSVHDVRHWMHQINQNAKEDVPRIIVGNSFPGDDDQNDQVTSKEESKEMGEALGREYNVNFFQTYSHENIGVTEAFESIARASLIAKLKKENAEKPIRLPC